MELQHNHREMRIASVWEQCEGINTFELDGGICAMAGQFVMAFLPGTSENPLTVAYDRPLRLTVKAVGGPDSFTNRIARMRPGDRIQITGPLGNGFRDLIDVDRTAYAITGGCGAACLPLLEKEMNELGGNVWYIAGAKARRHIPVDVLRKSQSSIIATEDGSYGIRGDILDAIDDARGCDLLREGTQAIVCGPRGMLVAAAEKLKGYLEERDIILSLEPYMKCGRGVCGSCEVAGYHACTDGPNFRYSDVMDAPDFRSYRRGKSGALEPL